MNSKQEIQKTIYRAVAENGPESWHVKIPELKLTTTARRIDQVANAAAEAICFSTDIEINWHFDISVELANPYRPKPDSPAAIVCDIDGTLALHNSRGPFEFDKVETDDINTPVYEFLNMYYNSGAQVVLLSGRQEEYRKHTQRWLLKHMVAYDHLFMRPAGDRRSDDIVKLELFDNHVRKRFKVSHVLDDRDRCVYLWRKLGLPCWQVAEGNF